MKTTLSCALVLCPVLIFAAAPSVSFGQYVVLPPPPCIYGNSEATQVGDPRGEYKYTIDAEWDSFAPQALSHLNVILNFDGCDCKCDFAFGAADTAGTSDGDVEEFDKAYIPCIVYYFALFECNGDPSIPGDEGPLVKFEPYEDECEPGPTGIGQFVFYSDWPPVQVSTPNQLLQFKYGGSDCSGELTGQLPQCTCSTRTESTSWGDVKQMFR